MATTTAGARIVASCAFALAATACAGARPDFDADYATAQANVATPAGAAFDRAVSTATQTEENARAVQACVAASPALQGQYRGLLRFEARGGYTAELRPDDALSRCLVAAYSGESLPSPPRRPYLLPLDFDAAPPPR